MSIKRVARVVVACFASVGVEAQTTLSHPWQVLNMPTMEEVRSTWAAPPPEYGPEPYYGLNGPVTLETVQHDLDTIKSLGFQAVTVQYGYGSGRRYLSPEWFAFFRQFVMEAKRRDLRVWIVDDAGYPSGFAGGMFTSEHPELRMQALVATAKVQVASGATFDQSVGANVVAVTAVHAGDCATQQVSMSAGRAVWKAPSDGWTVYVVEHAFRTSPTRSDTNPNRVKDGSQSLEDYLDPSATGQYLAFTHEAYKRAVGDEFGKTILGFRGDEPDYSIAGLPWTPKFFARFTAIKGYDIRPYLALFLQGRDAVLTSEQLRTRADYYDVFADMFRDGFFKPQGDWCAANGLEYQVHLNHEEMQLQLAHSEGDFFRDMRYVQVPGIDSIWHQIWKDTVSDFPRFASSAAHVYGHPRAFTESFAAYRPEPDIDMARYILNEQMVRGVNLVETMYFPAASTPARDGGPPHGGPSALMQDPQFPGLMQYVRRLSYLMSRGHPAAEVALLLPAESLWMGDARADDTFVSTERLLSEHQVDFDIVDEDAIGSLLPLEGSSFVSGSGNRYHTVLVPDAALLPSAVVGRLRRFATSGGKAVFLRALPQFIGGRNDLQAKPAGASEFSWGSLAPGDLPATPTPPAQPPVSAPGPLNVPQDFLAAITQALPQGALSLSQPSTALRFAHRKLRDGDIFLLFNESPLRLEDTVILRGHGQRVDIYDPQTGRTAPGVAAVTDKEGSLRMPLRMEPYATTVLVVR